MAYNNIQYMKMVIGYSLMTIFIYITLVSQVKTCSKLTSRFFFS